MKRLFAGVLGLAAVLTLVAPAFAGIEVHSFPDKASEQRYEKLTHELRCLVCQNETIAASNADLAKDLRQEIYEKVSAGQSDKEIVDFMVARYGDFVLYRPPFKPITILLWVGPFLMLATGLIILFLMIRRQGKADQAQPDGEQISRARKYLDTGNHDT